MPATYPLEAAVPVLALTVQATSAFVPPSRSSPADDRAVFPLTVQSVSVIVPPEFERGSSELGRGITREGTARQ